MKLMGNRAGSAVVVVPRLPIVGLRFCAKNRHGPPTSGFFVVPYIYFDSKKEKMPSSSTLEQRKN